MNANVDILVFAVRCLVPACLALDADLPADEGALPANWFHGIASFFRFHKKFPQRLLAPLYSANGVPRSPVGETHLQGDLTHALPRQVDAPGHLGLGQAIPV